MKMILGIARREEHLRKTKIEDEIKKQFLN